MENLREVNWTKEKEYTLIEAIQAAGELRSSGQSADIKEKRMRLWNDVMETLISSM